MLSNYFHEIQCQMIYSNVTNSKIEYKPYYLFPRSSISKTPLLMANSVGIIDKDYRGNIMAKVRMIPLNDTQDKYLVEAGTRLFQLCTPDLSPFKIKVVDNLSVTSRGEGGFGSTGHSASDIV